MAAARARQAERYEAMGLPASTTNGACPAAAVDEAAGAEPAALAMLRQGAETMRLSARGFHRVLRIARTLADLDAAARVARVHVAEALSYRQQVEGRRV